MQSFSFVVNNHHRMTHPVLQITVLLLMTLVRTFGVNVINDLKAAQFFLDAYNRRLPKLLNKNIMASWNYHTNITEHNQEIAMQCQMEIEKYAQGRAKHAARYNLTMMDTLMVRQFMAILDVGTAVQPDEKKRKRLLEIESEMEEIYFSAEGCLTPQNCLPLEPNLTNFFSTSRDFDKLLAAWKGWRDATGPKLKHLFTEYVTLNNEAAQLMLYQDAGEYWRSWYDSPTFEQDVQVLFNQLKPLYVQLHAFVRRRLKTIYGENAFPPTGHIPAHLLGDMWAQDWTSLEKELTPFKGKQMIDVTEAMVRKKYTAERIYRLADNFFDSLGMIKVPSSFWKKSMLTKPTDGRQVNCQPSAWDFSNGRDFRMKVCTEITQKHLDIAHHEMGHIQNFLQYKDQPVSFQNSANDGFHESVGDMISLSVRTPEHMKSIGLLKTVSTDNEAEINYLMSMALKRIAFLPFGYLVDLWRWNVFSGNIQPKDYNRRWWNLRCRLQGVSPPLRRTDSDFDPGSKYHVPGGIPFIKYFVSSVLEFQFYQALCKIAGHKGPLHRCDIYGSKAAGKALSNMLKLGSSKVWQEALYMLSGQTTMDARPLVEYFKPLLDYLQRENRNEYGWKPDCPI